MGDFNLAKKIPQKTKQKSSDDILQCSIHPVDGMKVIQLQYC